jgi:hypothetical protein
MITRKLVKIASPKFAIFSMNKSATLRSAAKWHSQAGDFETETNALRANETAYRQVGDCSSSREKGADGAAFAARFLPNHHLNFSWLATQC